MLLAFDDSCRCLPFLVVGVSSVCFLGQEGERHKPSALRRLHLVRFYPHERLVCLFLALVRLLCFPGVARQVSTSAATGV